jgi:S-layer homology domain
MVGATGLACRFAFQASTGDTVPVGFPRRLPISLVRRDPMMRLPLVRAILPMLVSASLAAQESPGTQARGKHAETWGPSTGYTMIMNYEFQGADAGAYFLQNGASQGSWCVGAGNAECLGYGRIQAPEGAILERLDLWGYDASPDSDLHYAVIANCDPEGGQVNAILDSGDLVAQDGEFHVGFTYTPGFPVNNSECGYTLRVKFTDPGEPSRHSAIRIRKARLSWTRQVSPAPPSATFVDVPTDHQFFQFIEALVRSGITAGCGLDAYCPDEPLTRGQMAVFLSKALGLQWPVPLSE